MWAATFSTYCIDLLKTLWEDNRLCIWHQICLEQDGICIQKSHRYLRARMGSKTLRSPTLTVHDIEIIASLA